MKSMTLSFVIISCVSSLLHASPMNVSAQELLSMPSANRLRIAEKQPLAKMYSDLIRVAFDKNENYQKRWSALTLAAQVRGPQSVADLERAMRAPEWFMRNAGLVAIYQVAPKRAKAWSMRLMKDSSLVVRSAAVLTLPERLTIKERQALWAELNADYNFRGKQSLWVRGQILEQLAKRPEHTEVKQFAQLLKDKDNRVLAPALVALEKASQAKISVKVESLEAKQAAWLNWAQKEKLL